jgi:two-component system cell cycle sensor histidine kinase PleC
LAALSQSFLDSARMGLVVLDSDQAIQAHYGGLVNGVRLGVKASEALPALIGLEEIIDQVMTGDLGSFVLPRISFDGSDEQVLSLEIRPSDQPGRLHVFVRDETAIAALEQEVIQKRNELSLAYDQLAREKARADKALRDKTAILANVSHDLKTPLQVIMGNADILKNDLPRSERERFLQDILDNGDYLLTLITDLLEASEIEAELRPLEEEPIEISPLLERVVLMAKRLPGGDRRHIEIEIDDGALGSMRVMGDPMRLQRLLLNILSNAVKFTNEGGRIAFKAVRTEAGQLRLTIADDGVGVEADFLGQIFEPFARRGRAEGSGLGLHIAKGLAALHQADLTMESQPGKGATAVLDIPECRLIEPRA